MDIWVSDSELFALAHTPALQLFSKDGTYLGQRVLNPEGENALPLGPVPSLPTYMRHGARKELE